MAARWGAGEETLTACNMELFTMETLDETDGLCPEETLETLQNCLDPSILSMFEDAPTIETKSLDEESEATLLTALTEILGNVDDENLSPFDTLPDSDLLSGQKGREHSPLRRLMCLSHSPPEKDTLCRTLSSGKSLPRILADSLQRSDGEEEEDSMSLSPVRDDLSPESALMDWEGLTLPLPVGLEQEDEDGVSLSLGDLVRNMHPYCMAICLEDDESEQMLAKGGIVLEVVDQGENGEPILAITDMDRPLSVPHLERFSEREQTILDEDEAASDSSEHIIVVDDEDIAVDEALLKVTAPAATGQCSDVKENTKAKRLKEEIKEKSPSRRKKKKKFKEQCQPEPTERRVLRSGTVRNIALESPKKAQRRLVKEEKRSRVPKVPLASTPAPTPSQPKKLNPRQNESQTKITTAATTTTTTPPLPVIMDAHVASAISPAQETALLNVSPDQSLASCSATVAVMSQQKATEKPEDSSAAPSALHPLTPSEAPAAAPIPVTPEMTEAPAVPEPKPKSLSLAEYRRLRQQKKPAPVAKQDDNSTKWPSLPELPKELLPIPCLPDPRGANPPTAKNPAEDEVRPAWQPRGPCAPPTPEALLVPPAYMVAASSKASAAVPKPQETPKPSPARNPPAPASDSVTHQHAAVQPTAPTLPQSSGSLATSRPAAVAQVVPLMNGKSSGEKCVVSEIPQTLKPESPKSIELTKPCPKTTTAVLKLIAAAAAAAGPKKITVFQKGPGETTLAPLTNPITHALLNNPIKPTLLNNALSSKPTATENQPRSPPAARTSGPHILKAEPETKEKPTPVVKPQRARNPTQELIESFTTEIGIEAADLTSLLEQFEETQAKEEKCVPEVSGRAAAVGNSSVELAPEKTVVERVRANDLCSTAALTPPATPPHQMWKPLAPLALLGKSKAAEASKLNSSPKVIQIEARPLPSVRTRSKPTLAAAPVPPEVACLDHDYCLPDKGTSPGETGKRWNVKQQSFITIKPIKQSAAATTTTTQTALASITQSLVPTKAAEIPLTEPLDHRPDGMERSSVLETPDASPARQEAEADVTEESPKRGHFGRSYRRRAASRSPSPRSRPDERTGGRSRKRRSYRSPSPMSSGSESDSQCSRSRSRSYSPSKKRYRPCHSQSASSSSSRSSSRSSGSASRSPPRRRKFSYSSSRSGSWSRSRSNSPSPRRPERWNRRLYSPLLRPAYVPNQNSEEAKRIKDKAIEERRIVYVGRIRGTMTQKELEERFSMFGRIEDCTLHFRDQGDNYGFVTYYSTKDAFTAIENGGKLRKPDELPFDLCFGGRRQFCKSSYADLDSSKEYEPAPVKGKIHALDFDTLLKQAQQNQKR